MIATRRRSERAAFLRPRASAGSLPSSPPERPASRARGSSSVYPLFFFSGSSSVAAPGRRPFLPTLSYAMPGAWDQATTCRSAPETHLLSLHNCDQEVVVVLGRRPQAPLFSFQPGARSQANTLTTPTRASDRGVLAARGSRSQALTLSSPSALGGSFIGILDLTDDYKDNLTETCDRGQKLGAI